MDHQLFVLNNLLYRRGFTTGLSALARLAASLR
jgi:hypothetical protein